MATSTRWCKIVSKTDLIKTKEWSPNPDLLIISAKWGITLYFVTKTTAIKTDVRPECHLRFLACLHPALCQACTFRNSRTYHWQLSGTKASTTCGTANICQLPTMVYANLITRPMKLKMTMTKCLIMDLQYHSLVSYLKQLLAIYKQFEILKSE